jgi:Tol biopolymer transport system component
MSKHLGRLVGWVALGIVGSWCGAAHAQWSTPIHAGPSINSPYSDGQPHLSPDGLTLYFASDRPGGHGAHDVWVAQRATTESAWEEPENLDINTAAVEGSPALSPDGSLLFFYSDRPGGCGGHDIWRSKRTDLDDPLSWQPPVKLSCATINSTAKESGVALFKNPNTGGTAMYFASNRLDPNNYEGFDIFASSLRSDGTFETPVLVQRVTSTAHDGGPSLSCDGLTMYFHSGRTGGSGAQDLWSSSRPSTAQPWGPPSNLGAIVNSAAVDHGPDISCDGGTLYFDSTRPGGSGDRDIWFTSAEED